jgi:hypothetical protein
MQLTSLSPAKAAFVVLVMLLCGAAAVHVFLLAFAGIQNTPPAGVARFGYLLVLLSGLAAITAGAVGSQKAITTGSVASPYLVAFAALYAVTVSAPDYPGWQNLSLGFHFNAEALKLGVNAVGVGLLIWHRKLVSSPEAAALPADTTNEHATT